MYKALNETRPAKNALTWEEKHKRGYANHFQDELKALREEIHRAKSMLQSFETNSSVSKS